MIYNIKSYYVKNHNVLFDVKSWDDIPLAIDHFNRAESGVKSIYLTQVKSCWSKNYLLFYFFCYDQDILSDFVDRGSPLYDQEVIEIFIAPQNRTNYYEINLSPRNVTFEANISNSLDGNNFESDTNWICNGLQTKIERCNFKKKYSFGPWKAVILIPFKQININNVNCGKEIYLNLFRIKRTPILEFSCWIPTYESPANFHIPKKFGKLSLVNKCF